MNFFEGSRISSYESIGVNMFLFFFLDEGQRSYIDTGAPRKPPLDAKPVLNTFLGQYVFGIHCRIMDTLRAGGSYNHYPLGHSIKDGW